MAGVELDLAGVCADVADDLADVSFVSEGSEVVYARGGEEFGRVTWDALEVRLPGDIAEAALRTPDTAAAGEHGWIRFTPSGAAQHVTDRAEAWFRTAWRHAADK